MLGSYSSPLTGEKSPTSHVHKRQWNCSFWYMDCLLHSYRLLIKTDQMGLLNLCSHENKRRAEPLFSQPHRTLLFSFSIISILYLAAGPSLKLSSDASQKGRPLSKGVSEVLPDLNHQMANRHHQQLVVGANLLVLQNPNLVAPQRTVRQGPAALAAAGPASLVVVPLLAKASPAGLKSLRGPVKMATLGLVNLVVPADLVNLVSLADLVNLVLPADPASLVVPPLVTKASLVSLGSHLAQEGGVLVQQILDSQLVYVLARRGVLVLIGVSSKIVALPVDVMNKLFFTTCFLDFSW